MKFWKVLFHICQLVLLIGLSTQATAADIRPIIYDTGAHREIVIEGTIDSGDFDKFIKIIQDNQGKISSVYIFSSGGNFDEAMKIGRAMRALELSSMVPMRGPSGGPICENDGFSLVPKNPENCTCASACFFIHIGGVHRGGTFLAVHRPYFEKGKFGELSEDDAKKEFDALQGRARNYMSEMGVPTHIQEDVLATASDNALILDEKTVKTNFWLDLPSRYEWMRNKCSQLSDDETARLEAYHRRKLTAAEQADFGSLIDKEVKETKCEAAVETQSNLTAYEKYFGAKPTDYANHNFSKWSEVTKYLGTSFDDITSEEKFEEKKSPPLTFLVRSATATAPFIQLSDATKGLDLTVVASMIFNGLPGPASDERTGAERVFKERLAAEQLLSEARSQMTAEDILQSEHFITEIKPANSGVVTAIDLASTPYPSDQFTQRLTRSLEGAWGKPSGGFGRYMKTKPPREH